MTPADPIPVPKRTSRKVLRALKERKDLWTFLTRFCRDTEGAGGRSYLVGGIVRDLIEGCPGRDVDLMVTGIGFGTLRGIVHALPRKKLGIRRIVEAGRQFPVFKVSASWSGEEIDVALARAERSTGPGHSQFEVRTDGVDARADASRRDFTVNSLMFSFRMEGNRLTGEVIDFFDGMGDIRRKRIRGVGNPGDRIREDPLRMLRAIRQKNERRGYSIGRTTWQAIRREARGLVGTISGERLVAELSKSLAADPAGTVRDLHRSGILEALIPEVRDWSSGPASRMRRRYDLLERRLGRPLPETPMFANLLVDVAEEEMEQLVPAGKRKSGPPRKPAGEGLPGRDALRLPRTNAVARRLHFPRVRQVVRMVEDLSRLSRLGMLRNPHAQIEAIFRRWEEPDRLHALYAAARGAAARKAVDFRPVLAKAARRPPFLTGDDVLALGIPAGPKVLQILEQVREGTLTGRVASREEALRLAVFLHADERLDALLHRRKNPGRKRGKRTGGRKEATKSSEAG